MGIIDNYLEELFGFGSNPQKQLEKIGFVDPNDKSLPNPYNFRQLKLDPKITKEDIKKADVEWQKLLDKGWTRADTDDGFYEVMRPIYKYPKSYVARTIIDKGKRVGIVISGTTEKKLTPKNNYFGLTYVAWVHGKNYAKAGIMKLLNLPELQQYSIDRKELVLRENYIEIVSENKASENVAKYITRNNLTDKYGDITEYTIEAPYWWNNNKLLKHK